MAYKALYRTYRPQRFSEVIGQDVIVKTLQNAINNNRISHAYLFCGPRGTGKTTVARLFAKALNCHEAVDAEPCNKCLTCEEITEGTSPDVVEIDAASNNGVDEIRELKDKVKFLPAGAKYKIYIIDEVHMLSTSAFNALLKTLEEPPKHAIFILATTEPQKVLATIVSRCQQYDFKSLTVDDLIDALNNVCKNEDVKCTKEALSILANASDGGFRDALSYLDQAISLSDDIIDEEVAAGVTGLVGQDKLLKLANYLEDKQITEALFLIQELKNSGREIGKIISSLLGFYRDMLLCKNIKTNFSEKYIEFAQKIDIRKIYFNIDALSDVQTKIRFGNTPELYLEVAIIKMINASSEDLDFGKRITDLENQISNSNFSGSSSATPEDLKRLRIIEEKFNNLVGELSRLEIHKLIERVKSLEAKDVNPMNSSPINNKEITSKIDKIIEDLQLLKVVQNTFRNELDNLRTGEIDESLLRDRIEETVKKTKPTINFTEIENFVKRQLENFEEKNNKEKEVSVRNDISFENSLSTKEIDEINERLTAIESKIVNSSEHQEDKEDSLEYITEINSLNDRITQLERDLQRSYENNRHEEKVEVKSSSIDNDSLDSLREDIHQLREKISKIESNVYKIMSGVLAPSPSTKRSKNKVNEKQISLWKDEIVDVDKINSSVVPKTDFLELAKEDDYIEEQDETSNNIENIDLEDEIDNNIINNDIESNDNDVSSSLDIEEEQINEGNLFGETEFGSDDEDFDEETDTKEDFVDANTLLDIEEEQTSNDDVEEIVYEENLFGDDELEKTNFDNKKVDLERIEELKRTEEEKTRKELEFKRQQEIRAKEEEKKIQEENLQKEKALERERIIAEQKKKQQEFEDSQKTVKVIDNNDLDEYERYDVKVLERIMIDALGNDYDADKGRLTTLWKHIVSLSPVEKRGVAELLAEGEIKDVGNQEFVLTYGSASICNQVMSRRFKKQAQKLLFDLLDGDYNYFAITRDVWNIKRREFADQHAIGIAYPVLRPITDPSLRVVNDDDDDDKMVKKIIDIFGENITIKKKE